FVYAGNPVAIVAADVAVAGVEGAHQRMPAVVGIPLIEAGQLVEVGPHGESDASRADELVRLQEEPGEKLHRPVLDRDRIQKAKVGRPGHLATPSTSIERRLCL